MRWPRSWATERAIGIAVDVTDEAQVEACFAKTVALLGQVDILVSNAGIQSVAPIEEFDFGKWRQLLAVHLDGAFLTTRAALRHMSRARSRGKHHLHGLRALQRGVGAEGALCHGKARPDRARQGRRQGRRASRGCASMSFAPDSCARPLVDKQIPEQARELGISEQDVIRNVMLKETVDGEFTTVEDVAQTALFLASFGSNALTGQSVVVSHGWHMQ